MKRYRFRSLGIRGIFSVIAVLEIMVAVGLVWGVTYLCDVILKRPPTITLPSTGWIFVFSILVSSGISVFVNQRLLAPIRKLSQAMSRVAAGDYNQKLPENNWIREIADSHANFNCMTRELRATEILQSDFISAVSHEIKTPINAIEGYSMLLQDNTLTPQERDEYIAKIQSNTVRLSDLVSNMLLLSRLDNAAIDTGAAELRLDEDIRQSILELETAWTAKEIEWDVELETVLCSANPLLIRRVWTNILSNAIKFSPQGGIIHVNLLTCGDKLRVSISDEGPGIPDADKPHVFDRFFQGKSLHQQEGHGLGLALVKAIVEFSGGTVTVQDHVPCGACFVVELPLRR